jgi:hypothetical protein
MIAFAAPTRHIVGAAISRRNDMSLFGKDVVGAESFYEKAALKSGFFAVDTVLLILASVCNILFFIRWGRKLGFLDNGYLFAALAGMWLLWTQALASHRKVRALYGPEGKAKIDPAQEPVIRIAATQTHIGMFISYLLLGLLFVEMGSLMRSFH